MSHHADEFDPEMTKHFLNVEDSLCGLTKPLSDFSNDPNLEKLMDKFNQRISEELKAEEKEPVKPRPTGNFPNGKLTKKDKGEMFLALAIKDNSVVLDFGKGVTWIGFTGNQAIQIGKLLVKYGRKLNRSNATTPANPGDQKVKGER